MCSSDLILYFVFCQFLYFCQFFRIISNSFIRNVIGIETLERLNWKVDYVITHCAPTAIQQKINADFKQDKLTEFLNEIQSRSQFHYWLFGHYHDNRIIDEKYVMLYEQMVRVL